MEDEEDCGAWVQFSAIGINSRMRNALERFAMRSQEVKDLPAAPRMGLGGCSAAGLASESEDAKTLDNDGEEIKQSAQSKSPATKNIARAGQLRQRG